MNTTASMIVLYQVSYYDIGTMIAGAAAAAAGVGVQDSCTRRSGTATTCYRCEALQAAVRSKLVPSRGEDDFSSSSSSVPLHACHTSSLALQKQYIGVSLALQQH